MLKLVIEDDEGRRTTVPLVRSEVTIGRQEGNTIRLTERNVSRRHARLVRAEEGVVVEDHSRYGTRHNGVPVRGQVTFSDGDVITIGDYRLHLRSDVASARGPSPEPVEIVDGRGIDDTAPNPSAEQGTDVMPTVEPLPVGERSRLVCLTAPFAGSEFHIVLADIVVGRSPDCDVVVDHPSVSKHHIRITTRGGEVRLLDLGSSNGVLVNGERTRDSVLTAGDEVELGILRFRYVAPGETFVFAWDEAIDDLDADAGRRGLLVPIIAAAAVLAIVAAVLLLRGSDPTPETAASDTGEADAPVVDDRTDGAALLAEAQRHVASARWDEALAAVAQVPDDSAQADSAATLATRAREELDNRVIYEDVLRLFDADEYQAALDRIDDIPRGSWYRSRVTDDDLERRVLSALVEERVAASVAAEDEGDRDQARRIVLETLGLAPDDPRLTSRLAQLDAADSGTTTPLVVDPPPAPPQPEPEPVRRDAEPDRRPERPAATPPPRQEAAPAVAVEPEPDVDPGQRAAELRRQAMSAGVQGMHQEAIGYLEQALALSPGDSSLNLMLYQNYNEVGNRRRAAQALERYLRQEPDTPRRAEFETWLQDNDPR